MKNGFTAIEVGVVFVIIGLLALLVVPGLLGISGSASNGTSEDASSFLDQMQIPHGPIECQGYDSDNNGYVTCSYSSNGQLNTIECPALTSVGNIVGTGTCRQYMGSGKKVW